MSLHKHFVSDIDSVSSLETWERFKEAIRDRMQDGAISDIDTQVEEIKEISLQYLEAVNMFMKLSYGAASIANSRMRAVMVENIVSILNEIGVLASRVFRSESEVVVASSENIVNNIIIPTFKMKDTLMGLKVFESIDSEAVDGALLSLDAMMRFLSAKSLGVLNSEDYSLVIGDNTVH